MTPAGLWIYILMALDEYFLMINLLPSASVAVCSWWFTVSRQDFLLNCALETHIVAWFSESGWAQNQRGLTWGVGGGAEGELWPPVCGISWNMGGRPHAMPMHTQRLCLLSICVCICVRACVWLGIFFFFRHASTESSFLCSLQTLTSAFPPSDLFFSFYTGFVALKTNPCC